MYETSNRFYLTEYYGEFSSGLKFRLELSFFKIFLFFWSLCCLSFNLWIMITPLVPSNSSYWSSRRTKIWIYITYITSHLSISRNKKQQKEIGSYWYKNLTFCLSWLCYQQFAKQSTSVNIDTYIIVVIFSVVNLRIINLE